MIKKALVITGQETQTDSSLARSLLKSGGLSLLSRQLILLKEAGISEIHIICDWYSDEIEKEVNSCTEKPALTIIHRSKEASIKIKSLLQSDALKEESWLIIEEGVLIDERILDNLLKAPEPFIIAALSPTTFHSAATPLGTVIDYKDKQVIFASAAKVPASILLDHLKDLIQLDRFADVINKISKTNNVHFCDIASIPSFDKKLNKETPVIWLPLCKKGDCSHGTDILISNAQEINLEWSVWYLYRLIQNYMCKNLCNFPHSFFLIPFVKILLGVGVIYLFSIGQNAAALISAAFVGILEGLHDKLTKITLRPKSLKKFLFFWNKLLPCLWYFGMAYALSDSLVLSEGILNIAPYIITACFTLFRLADVIQCEFFRRLSAKEIHGMSSFDKKVCRWGGYKNNILILLFLLLILGLWDWSLLAITIYSTVTFFINQIRIIGHIKTILEENNEIFVNNFKKTKIL